MTDEPLDLADVERRNAQHPSSLDRCGTITKLVKALRDVAPEMSGAGYGDWPEVYMRDTHGITDSGDSDEQGEA